MPNGAGLHRLAVALFALAALLLAGVLVTLATYAVRGRRASRSASHRARTDAETAAALLRIAQDRAKDFHARQGQRVGAPHLRDRRHS
jgi:hypothetical protein